MLASGAHVKIGDYEFRLALDQDQPYTYSLQPLSEEVTYWLMDDWSGGEGNTVYDPTDDTVYHTGLVNPRKPGQLTTPPTRANQADTSLSPAPETALTAIAGGSLIIVTEAVSSGSTHYYHTTGVTTNTTQLADTGWNTAIDSITAICTDGGNVYMFGYDAASTDYQCRYMDGAPVATSSLINLNSSNQVPIVGCGVLGDYLYYTNGNSIKYVKISDNAAAPATSPTVATTMGTGLSGLTYGTHYWAGMCDGDGALYAFRSSESYTKIWEITETSAPVEIWTMPLGFTAKDIKYQNGALLVLGDYGGESALWGFSTVSRQPMFLGFIGYGDGVQADVLGNGAGNEVLIMESSTASADGQSWIYDIGQDAFSQLDDFTWASGTIGSCGTFKGYRYAAAQNGTDMRLYYWTDDNTSDTTVDGRMESAAWDFDLPEEEKQLDGFHVLSDANGTKTVQVYYQDDEDGTWTSAGTATTGFHNYLQVSDASGTVNFRTLRVRVDPKTGATVYAVSARVQVNTYQEEWQLILDLTDEEVDRAGDRRRRDSQYKGWQLRDYLHTLATNKTVVTFLDGARYPAREGDDPDKYSTHTVTVTVPADIITKAGEGYMVARLKSVVTN
jgi:hypothetical protein